MNSYQLAGQDSLSLAIATIIGAFSSISPRMSDITDKEWIEMISIPDQPRAIQDDVFYHRASISKPNAPVLNALVYFTRHSVPSALLDAGSQGYAYVYVPCLVQVMYEGEQNASAVWNVTMPYVAKPQRVEEIFICKSLLGW